MIKAKKLILVPIHDLQHGEDRVYQVGEAGHDGHGSHPLSFRLALKFFSN